MQKFFISTLVIATLVSCSSPLDKKYNETTFTDDIKAIQSKVDTTESALLVGTVLRYKFQDKKLDDMTYRELIEDGKKFKAEQERIEAEQKALAEKARKEEEERIRKLNESLTVTVFDKGYVKVGYEDYLTYKFAFENKTDKDIIAFTGVMAFNDLFDKEIKSISLTYDDGVKANSKVTWTATTDYNQFREQDKALRNKDLDKIKLVWTPEKIIFKDGTTLE